MDGRPARSYRQGPAAPCRDCGTTGGYTDPDSRKPKRPRGLCSICYDRHRHKGTHLNYPKTHYPGGWGDLTMPTGLITPAMLGITPDQHAILPGGRALARHLYEDAEAFARCWLNARAQRAA